MWSELIFKTDLVSGRHSFLITLIELGLEPSTESSVPNLDFPDSKLLYFTIIIALCAPESWPMLKLLASEVYKPC